MSRENFSYRFSNAIVRQPGHSTSRGIRAVDRGSPNYQRFLAEHTNYALALEQAGVSLTTLEPLEDYPDSVFIEDAALCLPEGIIMTRPGAASRTNESVLLANKLTELGHNVIHNEADGFIDGGDVLMTESTIMVGLSERTDRAGFEWLKTVLDKWGYQAQAVSTPAGVLHFKSDCSVLGAQTILATHRLAQADCFSTFRVLTVPQGEEAAANSIRVNDTVLVPAGFPQTAELIASAGYRVHPVPVTQAALLDGGLSCMSLRLSRR